MLVINNIIPSKLLDSPDNLEILSVSLLGKTFRNLLNLYSSKYRDIIPFEYLQLSYYLFSFNDSEKLIYSPE